LLFPEYLGDGAEAAPPSQRVPVTHPGRAAPLGHPPPPRHLPVAERSTPETLTGVRSSSRPTATGRSLSEREGGVSGPRSGLRRGRRGSAPRPRSERRQGSDSPGRRGARGPGQVLNSPTPLLVWATWRGPTCVDLLGGKVGPSQQAHALAQQRTSLGAAHYSRAPRTATPVVLTLVPVTAPKPPATLPPRVCFTRRVRIKTMPTPVAQAPTLLHLPWARIVLTQTLPPPRG